MVTGHNEAEAFASDIQDLFSKQNFTTEPITLLTSKKVPNDCDLLIMLSPQSDYLEEEIKIIEAYLDEGKPVLFLTGYINDTLPNLGNLLKKYGLKNNEKLVIDKDKSRTAATGSTIMYPIVESHDITDDFDNAYVAMDVATGFTKLEKMPESVTVTTLLKTSDRGYLVNDVSSLGSVNSANSKKGEYVLGAVATKDLGGDKKSTLIAYSASSTFDANTQIETAMYMNADLIMNSIYYACDVDGAATISIPAKPIQDVKITMEGADIILWVMLTIIVVPVIILVIGFVVWMRRRRK
jgi:ABC-2 type transport system permease protein